MKNIDIWGTLFTYLNYRSSTVWIACLTVVFGIVQKDEMLISMGLGMIGIRASIKKLSDKTEL